MYAYYAANFLFLLQISSLSAWLNDLGPCEQKQLSKLPRWNELYTDEDQLKSQLKELCRMEKSWDLSAKLNIPQLNDPKLDLLKNPIKLNLSPHQKRYIDGGQRCKNGSVCLKTLAQASASGRKLTQKSIVRIKRQATPLKVVRKEYRAMSDQERRKFHRAILALKNAITSNGYNAFDLHASLHSAAYAPQAHFGCAFIPFHRIYLLMLEKQLQSVSGDKSLAIPYWDSTLDSTLPFPCDSVIFSENMLGPSSGFVNSGPFANFRSPEGVLFRNCRGNRTIRAKDFNLFAQFTNYSQFCFCVSSQLELVHGTVHKFVNGIMNDLNSASFDPCFWIHHSFIDKMYEDIQINWRIKLGDASFRASSCLTKGIDGLDEPMLPFGYRDNNTGQVVGLKNQDGVQSRFMQEDYEYAPSPSCVRKTCSGKYLFCDADICKSRIRNGGQCHKYLSALWRRTGTNACLDGYQCLQSILDDTTYACQAANIF